LILVFLKLNIKDVFELTFLLTINSNGSVLISYKASIVAEHFQRYQKQ